MKIAIIQIPDLRSLWCSRWISFKLKICRRKLSHFFSPGQAECYHLLFSTSCIKTTIKISHWPHYSVYHRLYEVGRYLFLKLFSRGLLHYLPQSSQSIEYVYTYSKLFWNWLNIEWIKANFIFKNKATA